MSLRKSRYTHEDLALQRFVHELRRAILVSGGALPSIPGSHLELQEALAAVCRKIKRNARPRYRGAST